MKTVPSLSLFTVRWFNTVDWGWHTHDVIAVDEAQVRRWVNAQSERQYRMHRQTGHPPHAPMEDSLSIQLQGEAHLPYPIWSRTPA